MTSRPRSSRNPRRINYARTSMEKFVKSCLILLPLLIFSGCSSLPLPGYISRVDHPYDRKFYAGFEKTVSSVMYVLKKKGWTITDEVDPAVYERDDRYDNNGYQNLLIITDVRKEFLRLTKARLNVFIHSIGDTCDIEIRYEGRVSAQGILDAIEQDIHG